VFPSILLWYSITNQCLLHVRDRFRFGVVLFLTILYLHDMGALSTTFVMIKRAKFQVLRTMQEVSLYTMKPPEPSIDPVANHRHLRIHMSLNGLHR
jgi:hypothetical protein